MEQYFTGEFGLNGSILLQNGYKCFSQNEMGEIQQH